ncbi:MAG: hypothetical protein GY880_02145 [Planctomycetaceae bacterium]|nr:hypothetical protein [Planctomycetaceae bacterium]
MQSAKFLLACIRFFSLVEKSLIETTQKEEFRGGIIGWGVNVKEAFRVRGFGIWAFTDAIGGGGA